MSIIQVGQAVTVENDRLVAYNSCSLGQPLFAAPITIKSGDTISFSVGLDGKHWPVAIVRDGEVIWSDDDQGAA